MYGGENRPASVRRAQEALRRSVGRVETSTEDIVVSVHADVTPLEIQDAQLAKEIHQQDVRDYEARRSMRRDELERQGSFSYSRPKNVKPYFCRAVMAITTLVMVLEIQQNDWEFEPFKVNPMLGPSVQTLNDLGAKSTEKILEGQVTRLITPIFLHAGFIRKS